MKDRPDVIESRWSGNVEAGDEVFLVRVWRAEEQLQRFYRNQDIPDACEGAGCLDELIERLRSLPRMNYVEITSLERGYEGCGVAWAENWP